MNCHKGAPIPLNDVDRLLALQKYNVLDTGAEADFDGFTQLASQICRTPIALISLVDKHRQWFKSKVGLEVSETPRDTAFCGYTILGDEILEIPNALDDDRFCQNPLVTGRPDIRFYAGMPLKSAEGFNLGSLCVIDKVPRQLSEDERNALTILGRQVASHLELRLAKKHLQEQVLVHKSLEHQLGEALREVKKRKAIEQKELRNKCAEIEVALQGSQDSSRKIDIKLRESIHRFAFLADSMPQIIWTAKPDGNIDYYNERWFDYTGLTLEETKDWGWKPVLHPDDLPACIDCWTVALTTGKTFEGEYRFRRASDGTYRWHLGRAFPMRNENDEIVQWIGTSTDIEEQKKARSILEAQVAERTLELTRARERLQAVLDTATQVSIIATDIEGLITVFNVGAERMLGYTAEEMVGQKTPILIHLESEVASRGYELSREFNKTVQGYDVLVENARHGKAEEREWTFIRKDGSRLAVNLVVTAKRHKDGRIIGFLGVAMDVTERKRADEKLRLSEERFRLIVDGVKDYALFMLDTEGRVVSWNSGAERIKGYHADEIIGENFSCFFPKDSVQRNHPQKMLKQATDVGRYEEEAWRLRKDGSQFLAHAVITPVYDETGELRGFAKVTRDITEPKRAEQQLTTFARRLELATNSLQAGIWDWNLSTDEVIWDEKMYEIYQIPIGHPVTYKVWADAVLPEDLSLLEAMLQKVISTKSQAISEFRIKQPNRPPRYIQMTACAILDSQRGVTHLLGITFDVTERKANEEALRQSQQRLCLALDAAQIGDWELNLSTRVTRRSLRHDQIFGYDTLVPDWGATQFIDHVHPDDRERVEATVQESIASNQEWYFECRIIRPDQTLRWIWGRGKKFDDGVRSPGYMVGMVGDITERKHAEEIFRVSEERFRQAFLYSAIGFALVELNGRWRTVNPALLEIVGYTEEELCTKTFQDITHPDDVKVNLQQARDLLEGRRTHYQMEKRYIHKTGRVIWALLNVSIIRHVDGAPAYFITQVQDVTQRHEAEEMIKAALEEKEVLLREIHHRVKNNMQVISSLLQLQTPFLFDARDIDIFKECQTRIRTMALVHERLYSSNSLSTIKFGEYLDDLAKLISTSQNTRGIYVQLNKDYDLVEFGLDIAIPLGLVANELISNCYKHAFTGRQKGTLTLRLKKMEQNEVLFSITDDGGGFPADLDSYKKKSLGMRLVDSLSRQIRAKITFKNLETGGACTELILQNSAH